MGVEKPSLRMGRLEGGGVLESFLVQGLRGLLQRVQHFSQDRFHFAGGTGFSKCGFGGRMKVVASDIIWGPNFWQRHAHLEVLLSEEGECNSVAIQAWS